MCFPKTLVIRGISDDFQLVLSHERLMRLKLGGDFFEPCTYEVHLHLPRIIIFRHYTFVGVFFPERACAFLIPSY